jgi:hypothetical protein
MDAFPFKNVGKDFCLFRSVVESVVSVLVI